jgi:DNA-binding PadR family transcriptional regulator
VTPLSYALLGLVGQQPRSGYALRKVFETTPLGSYSSSPGSIYPALKSLEKAGLIQARDAQDRRGKGLYHLTPQGDRALQAWLKAPIGDLGEAMLRFAFLDEEDRDGILDFLDRFEATALDQAQGLETFLAGEGARSMSAKARLAVEHGRHSLLASAEWARSARERFNRQ